MLPEPYYERDGITIYCGDALDILPELPQSDLVLTDPPYNVGVKYGESVDDAKDGSTYRLWLADIFRKCRASSLVYFPGCVNLYHAPEVLGDRPIRRTLGWHRKEFAGDKWCGGPAMSWEPIIWAAGPEEHYSKCFGRAGRDFLVVNATHGYRNGHPCPKPLEVLLWLVNLFSAEGDVVLDPFLGSGTTLIAAREFGRKAIGIEIEEKYCRIAVDRLRQGVLPFVTEHRAG